MPSDLPVNETGRGLRLHLVVGDREMVATPQGPVEAYRVVPRLIERAPRRQPVDATFWISTDTRHLLVAAEISAQFGRVRLKLVDYQP